MQITFREDWVDPRLKYDDLNGKFDLKPCDERFSWGDLVFCEMRFFLVLLAGKLKYLTMTETGRVWMPDTFFQNEKLGHFHDIIVPNVYIRIFPTGRVLYSIR